MSFKHDVRQSVAGVPATPLKTYTGTGSIGCSESIAVGTDTQVSLSLDVSAVKSIIIWSDRAIQLETNATDHSGGNLLTLKAGIPYIWNTDSYNTLLLTADVTTLYVTNASGGTALLEIRAIEDATP